MMEEEPFKNFEPIDNKDKEEPIDEEEPIDDREIKNPPSKFTIDNEDEDMGDDEDLENIVFQIYGEYDEKTVQFLKKSKLEDRNFDDYTTDN